MSATAPRRRHSPAVYRRRRLTVLMLLLAIVATVWLLMAQPWRGSATDRPADASAPSATTDAATALPVPSEAAPDTATSPSPSATPADAAKAPPKPTASAATDTLPCTDSDVLVDAVTDKDSYGSGQKPLFSIRLTNSGDVACTLNVGTSKQVFTVTSGSDVWWRSTDCQSEPSDMVVTLAAGQTVASATPLAWDRTRSSVKTCGDANRQKAPGGGASYHLSVEIGGIAGVESSQFLLY